MVVLEDSYRCILDGQLGEWTVNISVACRVDRVVFEAKMLGAMNSFLINEINEGLPRAHSRSLAGRWFLLHLTMSTT